jgi:hypothetical protein
MVSKVLIPKIQKILEGKELSVREIMEELKKQNNEKKNSSKRVSSFTSNQVAQIMRFKYFEKAGWSKKTNSNLWRNKNVMDRKIQTK